MRSRWQRLVVVAVVIFAAWGILWLAGQNVYEKWQDARVAHWTGQLAAKYDPDNKGQRGYIPLVITCSKNDRIAYAWAKADMDLKTGKMHVFEYQLPAKGFKCP